MNTSKKEVANNIKSRHFYEMMQYKFSKKSTILCYILNNVLTCCSEHDHHYLNFEDN
jgi:hypothetical protein